MSPRLRRSESLEHISATVLEDKAAREAAAAQRATDELQATMDHLELFVVVWTEGPGAWVLQVQYIASTVQARSALKSFLYSFSGQFFCNIKCSFNTFMSLKS